MARTAYLYVKFRDADEKESVEAYRLAQTLANDGSDMDDVLSAADTVVDQLDVMSVASLISYQVCVEIPGAAATPHEFSDVANYAFIRMQDTTTKKNTAYQLPAPDMSTYDASKRGILDPLFQSNWETIMDYVVDWVTGNALEFDYAQKRTKKRFAKNLG